MLLIYSKNKIKTNKALFLAIGEAFRQGRHTTIRGTPESYEGQKAASFSHVNFIEFLEKKHNIKIDVIINSYNTQYDSDLINWYNRNLLKYKLRKNLIGWFEIYETGIDLIENTNYDFIFVHRIDILFKSYLNKVFKIESQKVIYPTLVNGWGNIRPNDTMMFVPQKFFNLVFSKKLKCNHYTLETMKRSFLAKNVDYFMKGVWNSDTSKQWNPLYRIVNRFEPKSPSWKTSFIRML